MVDTATLQIRVTDTGVDRAKSGLRDLQNQAGRTEKATDGLTSAFNQLKSAIAAAGIGLLAREVLQNADAYQQLQARLNLVTGSAEETASVYQKLTDLTRSSHADIKASTDLYIKLSQSTQALGLDQAQLLQITDTVSKSFRISGASATESEAALRQLGQAFASGVLRGDEFNSMMENAPRLAQAMADSLGVTRGELRQMAAEGQLTSETMAAALLQQSGKIQSEFLKIPETVSSVMQDIRNELFNAAGSTDTSALVESMRELRDTLKDPQIKESLDLLAGALVTVTQKLVDGAVGFTNFGKDLGYLMARITGNVDELDKLTQEIESLQLSMSGDKFHQGSGRHWFMSPEEMQAELVRLEEMRDKVNEARYGTKYPKASAAATPEAAPVAAIPVKSAEEIAAEKAATDAEKERVETLDKLVDSIRREGEEAGKTARQIDLYRAAKLGANAEQIKAINLAHDLVDAEKARAEAAEASQRKAKEEEEQARRITEQRQQEYANLVESLRTEEEAILQSYQRRREIIMLNTPEGSAQREDLLGRLNKDFADEAMGDMQPRGGIDEQLAALQADYDRRRELMLANEATTQEQLLELQRGYEERKTQMLLGYQSMQLGNAASAFDSMASLAKTFGGEQSKSFQALFAVSKGFALAKAMVDMQAGISSGIALGWPMMIPAVAAAAAQGAQTIAAIRGQNFAGAFDAGGTIPAGSVGLVGEVGPELVSGPATVTSRKDTADMMGKKSEVRIAVFNLMDNAALVESLRNSEEFDEVIINTLTKNSSAAKSAMG